MSVIPHPTLKSKGIRLLNLRGDTMDTLIYRAENYELRKLAEVAVNISVIGVLVLCQVLLPIHASSNKIAQVTAPDFDTGQIKHKILNEISPESRQRNFDTSIRQNIQKQSLLI